MLLIIETILNHIFQKAFVIADSLEKKYLYGHISGFFPILLLFSKEKLWWMGTIHQEK